MQQDYLLLFLFCSVSRTFIFPPFPVAGFRVVNAVGGGLVADL